jgi:hypothetical protein
MKMKIENTKLKNEEIKQKIKNLLSRRNVAHGE